MKEFYAWQTVKHEKMEAMRKEQEEKKSGKTGI